MIVLLVAYRLKATGHVEFFKFNYLIMAIILAGSGKVLPIVVMIWEYHLIVLSVLIGIFVLTSTVTALHAFLNISVFEAGYIVFLAWCARTLCVAIGFFWGCAPQTVWP